MTTSRTKVFGREELIAQVSEMAFRDHQVIALTGEPGVGKTTVWSEVLAQADAAWSWSAQCLEAEAELGHAVLADFYRAVPESVVDALPVPQRRAVDIVLFRDDGDSPATVDSHLLGATTLSLLTLLAQEGPVAIGIDDVQWCDPTSLLTFDHAVHRLRKPGIAVLTSARTGSTRGLSDAVAVAVPRLPASVIRDLVRQVAGLSSPEDRVAKITELSGGNPFFARELALQATGAQEPTADGLPTSISGLLRRRLTGLDEGTRSLLLDVAVRGSGEPDQLDRDAVGRATRTGLLVREHDRLRFSHPLLSTAVLDAASADAIRAAHGRAAQWMQDPISVALHRARSADPSDEVASELDSAGALARDRGDLHGAAALAELAIRMTPRGARPAVRVMTLANLEYALGHMSRSGELAREVLPADDSPQLRASALVCVAGSLSDGDEAVAMLQEASNIKGLPLPDYARVIGHTAFMMNHNGRVLDAVEMIDVAVSTLEDAAAEWPGLVAIAAYLKRCAALPDDGLLLSRAVAVERARNAGTEGVIRSSHQAIGCAAITAVLDDRHEDAGALLREASIDAARHGELNYAAFYPGLLAGRMGNPRLALTLFTEAAEADGPNPLAQARLALASVWLGEFEMADDLVAQAREVLFSASDRAKSEIDYVLALKLALTGRPAEAWPLMRATVEFLDSISYREPSHPPVLPLAVEAACAAGDVAEAREICTRLQRDSTAIGSGFGAAAVSGSLGHISQALRDDAAAEAHFAAAAGAFTALGVPLEAARCLLWLGTLLRRTGRRSKARAVLVDARALIADSHALGLLNLIEAEEARISGRSASSPTQLTPSEQRVAELAAEGLRNADIARELHLSSKTVETHLGSAFRKLGIRSRAQLVRALK